MSMKNILLLFGSLIIILTNVDATNGTLDATTLAKRFLKILESELGTWYQMQAQYRYGVIIASTSCKKEIMLQQLGVVQSTMKAFEFELTDCFINSHEYTGKRNITKSGITCQKWTSNSPHEHRHDRFTDVENAENYCRDPDESGTPWCFTMDPTIRYENCAVPRCLTSQ